VEIIRIILDNFCGNYVGILWIISAHIKHSILYIFFECRNNPDAFLSKITEPRFCGSLLGAALVCKGHSGSVENHEAFVVFDRNASGLLRQRFLSKTTRPRLTRTAGAALVCKWLT